MYKTKNNQLPENIQKMFSVREGSYNLRGHNYFKTVTVCTVRRNFCISVFGVNSLNVELRECPNIKLFKKSWCLCIFMCISVYICVCMYVCIRVCICVYYYIYSNHNSYIYNYTTTAIATPEFLTTFLSKILRVPLQMDLPCLLVMTQSYVPSWSVVG